MPNLKFQLQQAISLTVKKATGLDIKPEEVFLEHPEKEEFGDYATNVAMTIFSNVKCQMSNVKTTTQNLKLHEFKNPRDLAEAIKNHLSIYPSTHLSIAFVSVAGPGFINLSINNEWLVKEMERVLKVGSEYIKLDKGENKKIMVEFAHPNTHKAFHIGHLRNISTGEAVVRILEACGYKVIRANYQGDVGMHIAKCLYGYIYKTDHEEFKKKYGTIEKMSPSEKVQVLGFAYMMGNKAFEEDEGAKQKILEINKKIYNNSDKQITQLWKETRQWSLDYFESIYKRVDSRFDRYYFESEVYSEGKKLVLDGLKKDIFVKSKGAIIFPGSKYGLHDRVFITQEGNPTYEGKDMGLGKLQFAEYNPDLIIHNVGPEQGDYFKVVFEALARLFPNTRGKEYHLMYGWVRLKEGKMSSRTGNVVLGEELLDKTKNSIYDLMMKLGGEEKDEHHWKLKKKKIVGGKNAIDDVAEIIAIGAVKYSFLKHNITSEIAYDFNESISLDGNSGPYLQYTYARAQSVLRKSQMSNVKCQSQMSNVKTIDLNPEELAVLRWVYRFPEVVEQAGKTYSPNLICNFLYELAQKYNTFYNRHRILKSQMSNVKCQSQMSNVKSDQTRFRLALTSATAQILKDGLYLLGIKAPEKM